MALAWSAGSIVWVGIRLSQSHRGVSVLYGSGSCGIADSMPFLWHGSCCSLAPICSLGWHSSCYHRRLLFAHCGRQRALKRWYDRPLQRESDCRRTEQTLYKGANFDEHAYATGRKFNDNASRMSPGVTPRRPKQAVIWGWRLWVHDTTRQREPYEEES